jgi:hypothetical protein
MGQVRRERFYTEKNYLRNKTKLTSCVLQQSEVYWHYDSLRKWLIQWSYP